MSQNKHLYKPRRSRYVPEDAWIDYPGSILASWHELADRNGFRVDRRVRDHLHLVLECKLCGAHTAHKTHTLRAGQPACGGCQANERERNAKKAGFTLLDRDDAHRHYYYYQLPCGHQTRLQRSRVKRLSKEGPAPGYSGYHCKTCHAEKQRSQAAKWGWTLVGPDPDGSANYRLLAHDMCGHHQRVATGNLKTGRFNCGGCGEKWSAAPSALYMMRFCVPGLGRFVKLGYSRNPDSRLRYQLGLRDDVETELIDELPMPSGQVALAVETGLHLQLRTAHPDAVLAPEVLADWINVTSEVYAEHLEPVIRRMFDELETTDRRKRE
ncbi:GIY-YIG nuclease family protein [Lentibacter sp. XHP0401]|uniref:GIY-YIG nuclease family protein n=1 Tax=Lentibacter sp. XHP0401 TaxID=2984334 RepID=UPI0021E8D18B|nr:GIY-YIG nuclease family protein [Lentibacter sp. XHP0401]MCV2894993.1 GIY-YIG nuclease family protein [Lentibacter sp. XHP0401]